jgi:hypothetical protein
MIGNWAATGNTRPTPVTDAAEFTGLKPTFAAAVRRHELYNR